MTDRGGNPMDQASVIFSGIVISAIGAAFYNLLPLFLGTAQDYRELSDQGVGLLGSLFFVGFTVTTITAFFWIRTANWRKVTLYALPFAAVTLVMVGTVNGYFWMATAVFFSGCAFSAIYGIGTTLLSDTSQPARWYGLKIASEASVGAVLLLLLPGAVISRWGFEGMMIVIAGVVLMLGTLLVRLPSTGSKDKVIEAGEGHSPMPTRLRLAVWISLCSATVFFFCITMIWAFVERMANDAGFDPVATGHVLSLSLACAVAGSLLAMWLGERLGSGRLFATGCFAIVISLVLLGRVSSLTEYAVAVCLFSISFGAGVPSVVTIIAQLDIDGRFVVLSVPAIGIGVMAAPAIGGVLTETIGYQSILWVGGISVILATICSMAALLSGLPALRDLRDSTGDQEIPGPML